MHPRARQTAAATVSRRSHAAAPVPALLRRGHTRPSPHPPSLVPLRPSHAPSTRGLCTSGTCLVDGCPLGRFSLPSAGECRLKPAPPNNQGQREHANARLQTCATSCPHIVQRGEEAFDVRLVVVGVEG